MKNWDELPNKNKDIKVTDKFGKIYNCYSYTPGISFADGFDSNTRNHETTKESYGWTEDTKDYYIYVGGIKQYLQENNVLLIDKDQSKNIVSRKYLLENFELYNE